VSLLILRAIMAAALAFVARSRGIKAYVVMPKTVSPVKRESVLGYGAEVINCEPTMEAREERLKRVLEQTGAVPIHPFDDVRIITGQGSAALELCETVGKLDAVLAPVGSGGLLSGTAIAVSGASSRTKIFGAEPHTADDAARSFRAGTIIKGTYPDTIADGLRTNVGNVTFPIIQQKVSDILTVSEEAIIEALRLVWERTKIVIEPSAAVALAALLRHRSAIPGDKIGIIFSGGNIDTRPLIKMLRTSCKKQ
jgi:threonine dehydratase